MSENNKKIQVPVSEKYTLTREEAMAYFNIGEKKMLQIIQDHVGDNTFVVNNGKKYLIIRKRFEKFIDSTSSL